MSKPIIGYRNDAFSDPGANSFTLQETLAFELFELNNFGMVDDILSACGYPPSQIDSIRTSFEQSPDVSGQKDSAEQWLIQRLIDACQQKTRIRTTLYGLWLCDTPDTVKDLYFDNSETGPVNRYVLPANSLVICNLGTDGKLYVIDRPKADLPVTNIETNTLT